ncbi:MAG TPA: thrombospondin type 3 repeat-containing protein, partial [Chthoniobacterales bacterium]
MKIRSAIKCEGLLIVALVCSLGHALRAAPIDTALTAKVWQLSYGLSEAQVNDGAWLAQDDDRDGLTNRSELAAGTNPRDALSTVAITRITADPATVYLRFPTANGKLYAIESSSRADAGWTGFQPAVQLVGDGSVKTVAATRIANAFYHVVFQDTDSDGDGVADWAEIVTGFNPNSTHTNGAATDDHATLSAQLPNTNIVTVVATEPTTTQPPDAATAPASTGSITVTRSGTLNFSTITVGLQKSGTAAEGIDYIALPSSVTLGPRVSAVKVPVIPAANPNRVSNATVTVQASPGGGYTLGAPSSGSVVIYPSGVPRGTGLTGHYYNSAAGELPANAYNAAAIFNPADLRLTRTDATVDFNFATTPPPNVATSNFAIRWSGQVQPQYSETYYFVTRTND